jgi:hypothetical protein
MGILDPLFHPLQAAQDVAENVGEKVKQGGGGILSTIIHAPGAILSGLFGALIGKAPIIAAFDFALSMFPGARAKLIEAIDGPEAATAYQNHVARDGPLGMGVDALEEGAAGAVASSVLGGGLLGSLGAVATVVGIVALRSKQPDGVKLAANDSSTTPPPTPPSARPKDTQAKG